MVHDPSLPHIVIVGAGFGGLSAALSLKKHRELRVTLIDRQNHHLFQPLLYQVACAALSPSDIAIPIRRLFHDALQVEVIMDEVCAIEAVHRRVKTKKTVIAYDYLLLAPGSEDNYFQHPEWRENAYGLKTLEDAIAIRNHVLKVFEIAEMSSDEVERQTYLTFIIVGGGPTGVEMAGAISELAHILKRDFHQLSSLPAKIILVEASAQILTSFPPSLSQAALEELHAKGIEVLLNRHVEDIDREGVIVDGKSYDAATVIWAAGVKSKPIAKWFDIPVNADKAGKIYVNSDLSLPQFPEIFVIGDAAAVVSPDGHSLPGVAAVAKQQGVFVAKQVLSEIKGTKRRMHFAYRDYGSLATIGRYFAVANFNKVSMAGLLAWLVWGWVHIYYLIGFRNRVMVLINWIWEYLIVTRGHRLIIENNNKPSHTE